MASSRLSVLGIITGFIGIGLIAGCGSSGTSSPPTAEMTSQDLNKTIKFVAASPGEVDALVKAVEIAVAHQDSSAFNALIDEGKMTDRILAGLNLKEEFRTGFIQGMREGGGLTNLSTEILGAVQNGGEYTFVRLVQVGDEQRPLFRLILPGSGGMNYHELVVTVDAQKKSRIADINVYLSGELLSQSIRRLVLPAVAAQDAGIMARLSGAESEFIKNINTMQKINELSTAEKFREAMPMFATLPESLQKDKTVLLMKLLIAQNIDDAEYANVIRDLERYFPNDPARDFRAMDLLAIQGEHEQLIKTVDRLLVSIQDPYLNILKVDSLIALDRTEDARKAVAEAKAVTLDRLDVYWVEVAMLLKAKDHAATAAALDEIGEKFQMTFGDLTTIPDYAEFAASSIGQEWMAKHSAENGEPPSTPENPQSPVPSTPNP